MVALWLCGSKMHFCTMRGREAFNHTTVWLCTQKEALRCFWILTHNHSFIANKFKRDSQSVVCTLFDIILLIDTIGLILSGLWRV
uniref:Uncharacterized protein n=1 Tax=Anguilla anguilla TaxID=7936 RepID=A0A0E9WN84_ANGAN